MSDKKNIAIRIEKNKEPELYEILENTDVPATKYFKKAALFYSAYKDQLDKIGKLDNDIKEIRKQTDSILRIVSGFSNSTIMSQESPEATLEKEEECDEINELTTNLDTSKELSSDLLDGFLGGFLDS